MWKRVGKGITAVSFGHLIAAAGNLLLVPLFLIRWSPVLYGEWLVLSSLAGYFSTLDIGMNPAVANQLTQAHAKGNWKEYGRIFHSAFLLYLCLAALGSLLLVLAILFLPSPTWLGLKELSRKEANWVLLLLGIYTLWSMPLGLPQFVNRTTGHLARAYWIANTQTFLTFALVAFVLIGGGGLLAVSVIQLAALLGVALFLVWDVAQRFPELTWGGSLASLRSLKKLFKPSLSFFLIAMAQVFTIQGVVLVISSVLGGAAVALFATSRGLVNLIKEAVAPLTTALWPELTGMEARQEYVRLRSLHRQVISGSLALCIAMAAALWFEGSEVLFVWTRGRLTPDPTLLRLLLLHLVLQVPWVTSSLFTAASSRHKKLSWSYLASAVLGVALSAILIRWTGTWGVPLGLIIAEGLSCYHFVLKDTCRMVGESYGSFARQLWTGLLVIAGAALASGWVAHVSIPGHFIIRWLGVGLLTSGMSLVLSWILWLTPEDRSALSYRLQPLTARLIIDQGRG